MLGEYNYFIDAIYKEVYKSYDISEKDVFDYFKNNYTVTTSFGKYKRLNNFYELDKISWKFVLKFVHWRNNGIIEMSDSNWYKRTENWYYATNIKPIFLTNFQDRNDLSSYDGYHSLFIDTTDNDNLKVRLIVYQDLEECYNNQKRQRICWFEFIIKKGTEPYDYLYEHCLKSYVKGKHCYKMVEDYETELVKKYANIILKEHES